MKFLALGLLNVLFATSVASAQTQPVTPNAAPATQTPPAPEASRPFEPKRRGSSAETRAEKSFMITAQPIGFGPSVILTQGLSAGFFVDPDSIIQVDFIGNNDEEYNDNNDWKVRALSVSLKQFIGNSFYVKPGIEHRWVREDYHDEGANKFWGYKGNMTGISFSVGNQWQINNFTLGCDWFGFTQSFLHDRTEEYTRGSNLGASQADLEDESDDSLKGMTFKFVHFYLGVSF